MFFILMVVGAALAPIIGMITGNAARIGITGTLMRSTIAPNFVGALPFGAGYSFGTYLGFPKNYMGVSENRPQYLRSQYSYNLSMPYGYYPRRRYRRSYGYSRRNRYGYRKRYGYRSYRGRY